MPISRNQVGTYAMLALVMLMWAGNSIVGRAVRDDIPPFTLALVRWALALAIVLPFAFRPLVRDRAILLRSWRIILFLGVVGVGGFNGLLYLGLHYTTAANGLLIQAAVPSIVLMLDFLVFRTRATAGQILGVILSTLGVALIVFRADPMVLMGLKFGFGDMLILLGVVAWSIYTVFLRLRPTTHPLSFIAVTFAIGALTMLPPAVNELRLGWRMNWQPEIVGAFLYVGIFPSIFAYMLYNRAVQRIGAGPTGQALGLMPLFGALLSALLLGENLHGYHLVGMVMILSGVLVTALLGNRIAADGAQPERSNPTAASRSNR